MSDTAREHERLFDEALAKLKTDAQKPLALLTRERFDYIGDLLRDFEGRKKAKEVAGLSD